MKQVPEGSEPVGASCPTCGADLVAPPGDDGVAWCPRDGCEETSFGFVRHLLMVVKRPKRDPEQPPAPLPVPEVHPVETVDDLVDSLDGALDVL
ncbi:MAG: hypothetical protein LC623_05500 [Halobacteriales archaeon]|nr:hypothetical protein [Halobacteriales archaeon]